MQQKGISQAIAANKNHTNPSLTWKNATELLFVYIIGSAALNHRAVFKRICAISHC